MKFYLVILLLLFSSPSAFADSFKARLSSGSYQNTFKKIKVSKDQLNQKLPIKFNLHIPGLGRAQVKLKTALNNSRSEASFSKDSQETKSTYYIQHYKGKIKTKYGSSLVSASAFTINNKETLFLSFTAKRAYRIKLNLSKKKLKKARIFRGSPSSYSLADSCATEHNVQNYPANSSVATRNYSPSTSAAYEVELRIDADRYWYQIFGDESHKFLAMFVQEAENIYKTEFDLSLKVIKQTVFTDMDFGHPFIDVRLSAYQDYIEENNIVPADLNHLFSGFESYADGSIGIARNIGTVCAFDIPSKSAINLASTEFTSLTKTPLTFAHELGHNLGSPHDDGFYCPLDNTKLMSSSAGGTEFSECSKSFINDTIEEVAACLVPTVADDDPGNTIPEQDPLDNIAPVGPPATTSLNAKLKRNGKVKLTFNFDSPETDCFYRFAWDTDKNAVDFTADFWTFEAKEPEKDINFKVAKQLIDKERLSSKSQKLFFKSFLICGNTNSVRAASEINKINLKKVRSNKRKIKKKKWIKKFQKKLLKSINAS